MALANEAIYLQGEPEMVDHTPGSALDAGKVIVTADTCRVTHRDLPASVLGAVAARGGVYTMIGDGVIAADKRVYWNDTTKKVTLTAGSNKVFGVTVTACAADGGTCQVRHDTGA